MERKQFNYEKQRTEFQNKLESIHSTWTCKLNLFVTDMNQQSDKTQADLKQIAQLLRKMESASESKIKLVAQRQAILHENYANMERKEQEQHLLNQLTDTEQMIVETQEQIQEIEEQIAKILKALEQRQDIINNQIKELNVIRQ